MDATGSSYSLHLGVGVGAIALVFVFLPIYARILWIFATNKAYRSLECYQLMIQIGIAQCLTGPSWFFTGLAHIIQVDHYKLAEWTYKLTGVMVRAEALLSVLLAVNRLRIICDWRCTSILKQKFQQSITYFTCGMIWLWCFIPMAMFVAGKAEFIVDPKEFLPRYDYTKPYSKLLQDIGSNQLIVTSLLTLVLYIVLVTNLVHRQCSAGITSQFKQEKAILAHAIARFLFEFSAAVLYNLGKYFLPVGDYVTVFVLFTYPLNNMIVPPVLYLTLYKSVREEFFVRKRADATVFTLSQNGRASRSLL
uniref:G protein-coupled receptor n=1 Tax=Steinernema glaseri TaxID=37863 RepID=A0A1I7Y1D7_9BILA